MEFKPKTTISAIVSLFLKIILTEPSFSENISLSKAILTSAGDVIIVEINSLDYTNIFSRLSHNTNLLFPFYPARNTSISIVPVPIDVWKKKLNLEVISNGKIIFREEIKLEYVEEMRKKKIKKLLLGKEAKSILTNTERILNDLKYIRDKITSIDPYMLQITPLPTLSLPSTNRITSFFGAGRKYPDGRIKYHKGVDFSGFPDDKAYSAGDGIVMISSNFLASGNSVYIYHGCGVISSYLHLSEVFVKEGEFISKGQVIGKIGQTGLATAPHLHLGMFILGKGGYVAINPLAIISPSSENKTIIAKITQNNTLPLTNVQSSPEHR